MNIGFTAVETFFPTENYIGWSKLFHLKEVVSIDCGLCPRVTEYSEEDYENIDWMGDHWVYNSLDFLLKKVDRTKEKQILATIREPEVDCKDLFVDERFKFYGYDLVEDGTCISALTNCGGFDKVFSPKDISEYGLIKQFNKVKEVQLKLREEYPYQDHADCAIWAIWKMI